MQRQNRKNDGLDHCMPMPVSNNNNNKNNGGNNSPYNGSYNQIYAGIPQTISPEMGNADSVRDMRSLTQNCGASGSMPNPNGGMAGYPQPQMVGMQPMNFNSYQQFSQRPWMPPGSMGAPGPMSAPGGFPAAAMYSYNPMPTYPPIYPPNPYGAAMGWNSPMVAPTMPIDGYSNFNGDDFKILGYGGPTAEESTGMNYQNSQSSGNGNSGRNSRMR